MSRYFLDNNVRQRLVHGVDKLRRPVNSTLFCHYGLFDRSLHTVKASRRDFIDNRLLVVFSIFLLISLIVVRLHSLSIPVFTSYISCASSLFIGFAAAFVPSRSFRDPFRQVAKSPPRISGFRTPITGLANKHPLPLSFPLPGSSRDPVRDLISDLYEFVGGRYVKNRIAARKHAFSVYTVTYVRYYQQRSFVASVWCKLWHDFILHRIYRSGEIGVSYRGY